MFLKIFKKNFFEYLEMLRNFEMLRSCFIYFYEIGIIESDVIYAKILDTLILRFTILNYLVYIFI